jgi:hypothetical protein
MVEFPMIYANMYSNQSQLKRNKHVGASVDSHNKLLWALVMEETGRISDDIC